MGTVLPSDAKLLVSVCLYTQHISQAQYFIGWTWAQ